MTARTGDANPGCSYPYLIRKYVISGKGASRMLSVKECGGSSQSAEVLGRYHGSFQVDMENSSLFSFIRDKLDAMQRKAGVGLMFELGEPSETGGRVTVTVYAYEPQNRHLVEFGRFKKD